MRTRPSIRGLAAAALALIVAAVGLVGTSAAPASALDTISRHVTSTVSLYGSPSAVAITPDSSTVLTADDTLTLYWIDAATRSIRTGMEIYGTPTDIATSPDGTRAYVVEQDIHTVLVVNVTSPNPVASIDVGGSPQAIAITPDGTRAFVTDSQNAAFSIIDFANNNAVSTFTFDGTGGGMDDVAISPDGTRAFMMGSYSGNLKVVDIDPNSGTYLQTLRSEGLYYSRSIAVAPDGADVYAADPPSSSGRRYHVADGYYDDTSFDTQSDPWAVAVSPDSSTVYFANKTSDSVSIVNASTLDFVVNFDVGSQPVAIAVAPNGTYAVTANAGDNTISFIGGPSASAPAAPTGLSATAGYQSTTIAFTPGSNGGSPITKYQYKVGNGPWTDAVGTSSPITITGLTNYTTPPIKLRAVNSVGAGAASSDIAARPRNHAPVLTSATATGRTTVRVAYNGIDFGGVTVKGYTVNAYLKGTSTLAGTCQTPAAGRSCIIKNLTANTEYDVRVINYFRFPASPTVARETLWSSKLTVRTNS